jgi:hypothetical protein
MKTTRIGKKLLSIVSIVISLLIIFTCVAFAASATANITNEETIKYTSSISAKKVKYSGHNNASSTNYLYFYTEYQKNNGNYAKSDYLLMAAGNGFSNFNDTQTTFSTPMTWRLEMNPYGPGTWGCSGSGTIASR